MRFQLVEKNRRPMPGLWSAAWVAALIGALLSLLDGMQYFYTVLPGVAVVVAAAFMSRKWKSVACVVGAAVCIIWFVLRFVPICDGWGFLANRLFDLSEEGKDYYYVHFNVVRNAPAESLFFVAWTLGVVCLLVGNGVNLVLTVCIAILIAYFGVSPDIVWLSILITAAFANGLPKEKRWLPAILVAVFVAVTAFTMKTVAPEPNVKITDFAEKIWEHFDPATPPEEPEFTEPTEPTELPEDFEIPEDFEMPENSELPEDFEPPVAPEIQENPNEEGTEPGPENVGGHVQEESKKIPIMPILVTILSVLSVWGLLLLYIRKKAKRNRAAMYVQNNAEAIRGMYLYARRWRSLHDCPGDIPTEIQDIWLEAAFSEHEMTDAQRSTMLSFVRYTAADTWNTISWWRRVVVILWYGL